MKDRTTDRLGMAVFGLIALCALISVGLGNEHQWFTFILSGAAGWVFYYESKTEEEENDDDTK